MYQGYHEVPEKTKANLGKTRQIDYQKVALDNTLVVGENSTESDSGGASRVVEKDKQATESQPKQEYISGDMKFLTTVVIALATIIAVVYFGPRVRNFNVS